MSRAILDRRTVLWGAARAGLATIALPRLDGMLDGNGTAYADGTPLPVRFGSWLWTGGIKRDGWIPGATGLDWQLTPLTQPLAKVKPDISIVTGMAARGEDGGRAAAHAGTLSAMMTGAPPIFLNPSKDNATTVSKASMDVEVAEVIGTTTRFKSLQLGVLDNIRDDIVANGPLQTYNSFISSTSFNFNEFSPAALFGRLFSNGASAPLRPAYEKEARKSVLDFVLEDAARLRARVGKSDRARLDQHMTGIRALETRMESSEPASGPWGCAAPASVPDPSQDQLSARNRLMTDLLVMALRCDLSRAFSLRLIGQDNVYLHEIGFNRNVHELTHDEPGDQPMVRQAIVFMMEQLAYFLEQLQAAEEGGGSLIHRCAILATSDNTEGVDHSSDDTPIILAGRAGGRLKSGLHYRGKGDNPTKVLLTIRRALGLQEDGYGVGALRATESLGELEAAKV